MQLGLVLQTLCAFYKQKSTFAVRLRGNTSARVILNVTTSVASLVLDGGPAKLLAFPGLFVLSDNVKRRRKN